MRCAFNAYCRDFYLSPYTGMPILNLVLSFMYVGHAIVEFNIKIHDRHSSRDARTLI
jgi:hypothetical protein